MKNWQAACRKSVRWLECHNHGKTYSMEGTNSSDEETKGLIQGYLWTSMAEIFYSCNSLINEGKKRSFSEKVIK